MSEAWAGSVLYEKREDIRVACSEQLSTCLWKAPVLEAHSAPVAPAVLAALKVSDGTATDCNLQWKGAVQCASAIAVNTVSPESEVSLQPQFFLRE